MFFGHYLSHESPRKRVLVMSTPKSLSRGLEQNVCVCVCDLEGPKFNMAFTVNFLFTSIGAGLLLAKNEKRKTRPQMAPIFCRALRAVVLKFEVRLGM